MEQGSTLDTSAGAAVYSPVTLKLYDFVVLNFSNRFTWKCSTDTVLLPFFQQHLGPRHLDVGVGTGYYLEKTKFQADQKLALLDLNPDSLKAAAARAGRTCDLYSGDIMQPHPLPEGCVFDSISLFYLYHCLPGTMAEKAAGIANLSPYLAPGGTIYGATILGESAGHNALGRKLINIYNAKGVFGNRHDTLEGITAALQQHFQQVDIRQQGKVALFVVRQPIS